MHQLVRLSGTCSEAGPLHTTTKMPSRAKAREKGVYLMNPAESFKKRQALSHISFHPSSNILLYQNPSTHTL